MHGDTDALAVLLEQFRSADCPVELRQQERHLNWRRWRSLGSYEAFVLRQEKLGASMCGLEGLS